MIYGIDYLAGATYSQLLINNHPKGWAAGFFANTFGNAFPTIRALAKTGKCPVIRVHAVWDDLHRYNPTTHNPIIKNEFKKCVAAAKKFPKVQFQFSPFCEHTIEQRKFDDIVVNLQASLPDDVKNIIFVNSSLKGDYIYDAKMIINECHGSKSSIPRKGRYNFSYDGQDCYNANVESDKKKQSKAEIFFFWTLSLNLKKNEKDKRTVAQRVADTYRPTKTNLDACIIMAEKKKEANTPSTWIVKPMSENVGDFKSNKLLIIMPADSSVEKIEMKWKGKVLAELKRFTPDYDGKGRFYAAKAGCEYGNKVCNIWINGVKNKSVNPAFRGGSYK